MAQVIAKKKKETRVKEFSVKLIKCKPCNGTGEVDCCNGHMCPGTKLCYDCDGKGKVLSTKDRKKKEQLQKLMEYK